MPWPMIHFAIAVQMFGGNPSQPFLLGSIAPDAVLFRKDKSAKANSHLLNRKGDCPDWSGLVDFYNNRIAVSRQAEYKMFLLGYVSHLIADELWVNRKREISAGDKRVLRQIWDEENKMDFHLYRTVPWKAQIEVLVSNAGLFELFDMYTLDELDNWRKQLFVWLRTPENEPVIELHYLAESNVKAFIEEAAASISAWIIRNISKPYEQNDIS